MGKTSVRSRFNIPGRIAWITMETPGCATLLYMMSTLPGKHGIVDLPWQNKVLAGLFAIHYSYRAIAFPLMQPSMSPIHPIVWAAALLFQLLNGTCLGSWLAAYGPTTHEAWRQQLAPWPTLQFAAGIAIFYLGLAANYYHDDSLARDGAAGQQEKGGRSCHQGQDQGQWHREALPDPPGRPVQDHALPTLFCRVGRVDGLLDGSRLGLCAGPRLCLE
jgi:hypothetical protein